MDDAIDMALKYLSWVRHEFLDEPKVFHDFLDIMKAFKAEQIDTNEVINRVIHLFAGHPALILCFGAFLPPDFEIDVIQMEDDQYSVIVKKKISRTASHMHAMSMSNHAPKPSATASDLESGTNSPEELPNTSVLTPPPPSSTGNLDNEAVTSSPIPGALVPNPNDSLLSLSTPVLEHRSSAENTKAVEYVLSLKEHLKHDPIACSQFQALLDAYRKQERTGVLEMGMRLTEEEVYRKVTELIGSGREDLIRDLRHFLPGFLGE